MRPGTCALLSAALLLAGCVGPSAHVPSEERWLVPATDRAGVGLPGAAPAAGGPFRIVVYGDSRGDHAAHAAVVEAIRGEHPDLVVHTGDAVECYPVGHLPDLGGWGYFLPLWPQVLRGYPLFSLTSLIPFPQVLHEVVFSAFYPVRDPAGWNGFLKDIAGLRLVDRVPFVFVPGNHDLYHDFDREEVARLFGEPGGAGGRDPDRLWFALDLPGVRLIVLDTGTDLFGAGDPLAEDTGQVAWLADEIRSARERGLTPLVALHLPPFSSGMEDGAVPPVRDALVGPVFDALGVPLVLCGHAHGYERIERTTPGGGRTVYVTTGGGGAPFHHAEPPEEREPGSQLFVEATLHYVLLELHPDRIVATVRSVAHPGTAGDDTVIDRFEVQRRSGSRPASGPWSGNS